MIKYSADWFYSAVPSNDASHFASHGGGQKQEGEQRQHQKRRRRVSEEVGIECINLS